MARRWGQAAGSASALSSTHQTHLLVVVHGQAVTQLHLDRLGLGDRLRRAEQAARRRAAAQVQAAGGWQAHRPADRHASGIAGRGVARQRSRGSESGARTHKHSAEEACRLLLGAIPSAAGHRSARRRWPGVALQAGSQPNSVIAESAASLAPPSRLRAMPPMQGRAAPLSLRSWPLAAAASGLALSSQRCSQRRAAMCVGCSACRRGHSPVRTRRRQDAAALRPAAPCRSTPTGLGGAGTPTALLHMQGGGGSWWFMPAAGCRRCPAGRPPLASRQEEAGGEGAAPSTTPAAACTALRLSQRGPPAPTQHIHRHGGAGRAQDKRWVLLGRCRCSLSEAAPIRASGGRARSREEPGWCLPSGMLKTVRQR